MLKEESSAGIWKLSKELSDLGGGGWKGSKNPPGGGGGGWNGSGPELGGATDGDGGGERLLLLFSVGSCLSLHLFNRFFKSQ